MTRLVRDKVPITVLPAVEFEINGVSQPGAAQPGCNAALGLTAQHALQLASNSFEASFIDASAKRAYQDQWAQWFETFEAGQRC